MNKIYCDVCGTELEVYTGCVVDLCNTCLSRLHGIKRAVDASLGGGEAWKPTVPEKELILKLLEHAPKWLAAKTPLPEVVRTTSP